MKGIFNMDSPLMSLLSRVADLMILNLWTILCCLPIVTIGASLSSMYYVLLRLHSEEYDSVTKDFFHSFRMNFKQATGLWLIYMVVIAVVVEDYFLMYVEGVQILYRLRFAVHIVAALVLISLPWCLVQMSRYSNSTANIVQNSFRIALAYFVRTIAMALLTLTPIVIVAIYPTAIPVILVIGVSLPGYLQIILFSPVLKKLEQPEIESKTDIEETIQQS